MIDLVMSENTMRAKYYPAHYYFFIEYARLAGISLKVSTDSPAVFAGRKTIDDPVFSCTINGRQAVFDFSDFADWDLSVPGVKYFKFQAQGKLNPHVIPLGPPMIGTVFTRIRSSVTAYMTLRDSFRYSPGTVIINKQSPYGNALDRRRLVKQILAENFQHSDISNGKGRQYDFWKSHEHALLAVCVPGATNNMVDRGHMELIGLGVCTVSPRLDTIFPWHKLLEPGVHYLQCKDDYSDLADIIRDAEANKDLCKDIGNNAREFFNKYYTPTKYWQWILENMNNG